MPESLKSEHDLVHEPVSGSKVFQRNMDVLNHALQQALLSETITLPDPAYAAEGFPCSHVMGYLDKQTGEVFSAADLPEDRRDGAVPIDLYFMVDPVSQTFFRIFKFMPQAEISTSARTELEKAVREYNRTHQLGRAFK